MNKGLKTILILILLAVTAGLAYYAYKVQLARADFSNFSQSESGQTLLNQDICKTDEALDCILVQSFNGEVTNGNLNVFGNSFAITTGSSPSLGKAGTAGLTVQLLNTKDQSYQIDVSKLVTDSAGQSFCVAGRQIYSYILNDQTAINAVILQQNTKLIQLYSCSETAEQKQGFLSSDNLDQVLLTSLDANK
jgi:hypothetical protein